MTVLIHTECSLKEELEALKIHLERAVEEYRGKLSWSLSVGAEVDMGLTIPKKLIQLFVENAISGGLIQNGNGGSLEVSAHVTSLGMLIMINDHGISFRDIPMIRQQREHRLRGLDACLEQFNEKHPYRIHYNILDRSIHDSEKSGSRILITIQNQ